MIWGHVFREFAARLVGLSLWKYASMTSSLVGERERKSCVHGLRQGLKDPVPASFGKYIAGLCGCLQRFYRSGMTHYFFPDTISMHACRACGLIFSRDLYQIAEVRLKPVGLISSISAVRQVVLTFFRLQLYLAI